MPGGVATKNFLFIKVAILNFKMASFEKGSLQKWTLSGMIILIIMVFIIFLYYEINANNTRKLIVIFMAYPMLIKDEENVEI